MFEEEVFKLIHMMKDATVTGEYRAVFLHSDNKDTVRAIGEYLNTVGGFRAMMIVADGVTEFALGSGNIEYRYDLRGLDFAWNGIGDWCS